MNAPVDYTDEIALSNAILDGDRAALSRAITMVESTRRDHQVLAAKVVERCLPQSGKSIRVGITGVPGVGKSTFIEALGTMLCDDGHQLAVLAIDPSSERTKGSILGDKTRMEALSSHKNAYIRPSPTSGSLGGVARKTRESILLCEAAGFNVIFVETVGVGQSETEVHSMVDFFLLLMLAGAGDELQGIKRGITELSDAMVITKADGDNEKPAKRAAQEYQGALHLFPAGPGNWTPQVLTASAYTREGIEKVWEVIRKKVTSFEEQGLFSQHRLNQTEHWFEATLKELLLEQYFSVQEDSNDYQKVLTEVKAGSRSPLLAAMQLLKITN